MLKILKNKNILYILLSVGFFLIINAVNIYYYVKANYIAGWDGFGHVAISYAYHNEVFPHIFGNIKVWFNGMPFSHFYPPLFYVTTSFLAFVKDQALFVNLFKIFNISMLIVTVIGFYFLALEFLKSKEKALVANMVFVLLLSTYKKFGDLGISVESVFNYGFLPQSFSFIFLILFLIFFNKESTVKNRILSLLSLLCVAISNIHVLFIAVFYICTYHAYLLYTKDFIELKKKMIDCSLAGLISLFWFLPMFYYYQFSGAKSSNYGGFEFIDNYLIISMIFSAISVYIAHKEKNKKIAILALYIFIISTCNYLPLTELIVSIPLHVKRWIIAPILLLPILSLYIINKNKILKGIGFIALITVFFTYIFSVPQQNMLGYFTTAAQDEFQPMLDWIIANKKDSDLINVESAYIGDVSDFWYIHAALGMSGVNTTYAILRESSVMSFAFATIRNSISTDQEAIGTKFNLFGQNKKRNY
ncbi:hypothetical protein H7X65_01315, partial [Candidatus Parcubacteria bacterium]|nr:hypothetical protein [Candidatus Parcubacteria bacterium]